MLIKQVMEMFELLDSPAASGGEVARGLERRGPAEITVRTIRDGDNSTDFIRIAVAGRAGKIAGGTAPTLGIVGRLGGIGARPEVTGFVSDADGALCALAVAAKLLDM